MILFRQEHVDPILLRQKTQTRRLGKPRWRVGSIRGCYVRSPRAGGQPFARVRIASVRQERLGDISREDARREGYASVDAYLEGFCRINRKPLTQAVLDLVVNVLDFELVGSRESGPGRPVS